MRPRRSARRRALAGLALAVVAMVGAGCEVSGAVLVDVDEDGSGVVTVEVVLDDDASSRLGDPATEVRTDDLEAAGWDRHTPERRGEDTVLAVSKDFLAPEQLQSVLAEVGGTMFEGFDVTIEDGFASTTWSVEGEVSTTGDLTALGDDRLAAALDGLAIGRTPEELATEFGGAPTVPLDVVIRLPGEGDDFRAQLDLAQGGVQRLDVVVTADSTSSTPILLAGVAGALLVAAVVWRLTVVGRRRSNT